MPEFPCVGLPAAPKSAVLEEMLHNLDFCDILVLGGDLDPRQECLELNHSELHQRHLDATNSTAGYSVYGKPRSARILAVSSWSGLTQGGTSSPMIVSGGGPGPQSMGFRPFLCEPLQHLENLDHIL